MLLVVCAVAIVGVVVVHRVTRNTDAPIASAPPEEPVMVAPREPPVIAPAPRPRPVVVVPDVVIAPVVVSAPIAPSPTVVPSESQPAREALDPRVITEVRELAARRDKLIATLTASGMAANTAQSTARSLMSAEVVVQLQRVEGDDPAWQVRAAAYREERDKALKQGLSETEIGQLRARMFPADGLTRAEAWDALDRMLRGTDARP